MQTKYITKLSNYQVPSWLIKHTSLIIFLNKTHTKVIGKIYFYPNNLYESNLLLNGVDLRLTSLKIDGNPVNFTTLIQKNGDLILTNLPKKEFTLETEVIICPEKNLSLSGLYLSNNIYCTQCEAEGFRKITYFPDRPDILSTFETIIIADKTDNPILLSNGNLIERQDLPNNKHQTTWQDPIPKPCYLFALVAGQLAVTSDSYILESKKIIALNIYTEVHNKHLCDYAMESLIHAIRWDEITYSRLYDLSVFNIVAVDDFNSGAMENKGLNIFNSKYILADTQTATDIDFINIQAVIGHEYFHNWTGNRITCRDWFQLSLKEGLTVFREQQFMSDFYSQDVARITDVKLLKTFQFAEDKSPLSHPVRPSEYIKINNFYTYTVYEKGAEIIRMFYNILGKKAYYQAMSLYFELFDGQAITIEDLLFCFNQVSSLDLCQMKLWYLVKGTPKLHANWSYNPDINGFNLTLSQSCKYNHGYQNLFIPVKISWITEKYQDDSDMIILNQSEQIYQFPNIPQNASPSLLQGFSAPVELVANYDTNELCKLVNYDNDKFNRWQALQSLFNRILLNKLPVDKISNLLSKIMDDCDLAWRAEMLELPTFANITEQLESLDIDFLVTQYPKVFRNIAKHLADKILFLLKNQQQFNKNIDTVSMANRQFEHNILWILSFYDKKKSAKLASKKFYKSCHMTDKISALKIALNTEDDSVEILLDNFYQTYKHDTLVINKWFALQASVAKGAVLKKVINLTKHPDFNWKNPNRLLALVDTFSKNLEHFHHHDGLGYQFVAKWVLKVDKINPQIAAKLAKSFAVIDKLTCVRKAKLHAVIKDLSQQKLSDNVAEIIGLFL